MVTRSKRKKAKEEWMPYEDISDSVKQISEGYLQLCDTWTDLQEGIASRIEKSAKEQRKLYEDFTDKWTDFNRTIGSKATKNIGDVQWREFYDIWRNYTNKMLHRLSSAMNATTKRYENLQKNWRDLSTNFNSQLSAIASGDQIDWQQTYLYDNWRGLTSEMQGWMEEAAKYGSDELNQLEKTWANFSTKVGKVVGSLQTDGESYKDLIDLWAEQSTALGKNLNSLVSSDNGRFAGLQKAWLDYLSRVEKEVLRVTKNFGANYEELWKWYFDSQDSWQDMFRTSTRKENEDLRKQVKALSKRVEKLEKSR